MLVLIGLTGAVGAARGQQPFPYHLKAVREGVLLATGAAALGLSVDLNSRLEPLTEAEIAALDPASINGFDRGATDNWSPSASNLSDVTLVATVGAALSTVAMARGESAPLTVGVMLGETLLVGNGISELVKTAVRRTRPYVYNDDPDITLEEKTTKTARQSFPSGHTVNAFASAVFLSTVYGRLHPTSPARAWIWGGSLAVAGTTSYLRFAAGKHFPTDIIAGAVLGGGLGWLIPHLHESDRVQAAVTPTADGPVVGLSVRF